MKKFFILILSALVLLSSCKEEVVPVPTVKVTAGEATETTLSFVVTPDKAETAAYICVEGTSEIPSADKILTEGVKFAADKESTQTITDLKMGTEYTIAVAVGAGPHKVAAPPVKMRTNDEPVPSITLTTGNALENSVTFYVTSVNATKATYIIQSTGSAPDAQAVIENGTEVEVGENILVTVNELTPATAYTIYAAATDGKNTTEVESINMTTTVSGEGIVEVTGRRWNKYNYGLNIYNAEGAYAFINMYLDAPAPGGVLPEGTYNVLSYDGELDPNSGEPITPVETSFIWDMGSLITFDDQYYNTGNYTSPKEGYITVSHINNGYRIEVDITDTDGYNFKGTYEGAVAGTFDLEGFANPPIPWDEKTITGTFSSVKGANFGDEGGFYLWLVTEQEAYDIFLILRNPIVDDGLIPEGTYTVGLFDEENPNALVIDGTEEQIHAQRPEEQYRYIVDGGTLTVTHSTGAYILDLDIENELKTKFDITWEGAITNQWDDGNDFVNPTGPSTPAIEWGTIEGKYYEDSNYSVWATSTDGQTSIYMDLYCPTSYYNIIPEGEYKVAAYSEPITTPFVDSYSYVTFEHGGAEVYFTDGYAKVEHLKEGYDIRVNVTLSNGETFKTNITGVFTDKDESGFANPPIPGGEENNCTVLGAAGSWGRTSFTVVVKEGTKEKLNLNLNCPSSVCNIIPEGQYIVETNVSWENPSQYDYYINGANSYAGNSSLTEGVMIVEHLESGYKITFNGTDAAGNEYDYFYMGTVDPVDRYSVIGNPPVPYRDETINTEFLALTGDHLGPSTTFNLTVMLADYPYDMSLTLETPEKVTDGIIPEGTYTIGGEYNLSTSSSVNDGEWAMGLTAGSKVIVSHLSEGYRIELDVETELLTKVKAVREGLIFKSEGAQYPFQNPGYEYEPYIEVAFDQGAYAGEYTTYNAGLEFKKYVFTNNSGDYMEMVFDIETATPYLQAGTYFPCDEYNPSFPYGPFTFYGNGCALTVAGSGQQYPYYLQGGNIEVSVENGIYTIVMKAYAWINGNQLVKVTYTGDLEGIAGEGGNEGGEEDGDYITLSSCEFVGDLMNYGILNQFVAKSSDNNHVIYFSLSQLPGMSKESYIASGDYTLVSANTIAANTTSYYFNMSLLEEDQLHVIDGESYFIIEDNSGSTMNVVSEGDGANHVITLVVNKGGNTYNYRFNGTIQ